MREYTYTVKADEHGWGVEYKVLRDGNLAIKRHVYPSLIVDIFTNNQYGLESAFKRAHSKAKKEIEIMKELEQ